MKAVNLFGHLADSKIKKSGRKKGEDKIFKANAIFGDYQACRVIWITTLKGELLVKFTITDGEGKHLYTIMEPPESDTFDLSNNVLSLEQLEEIRDLLKANNPEIEWDITDEEEVIFMLGFFGECLARRHWLARDSKKNEDVIADYIFDASDKIVKGECFQTDYFKKKQQKVKSSKTICFLNY